MTTPNYTGRETSLLIAVQNPTPTPQDIREGQSWADRMAKRLAELVEPIRVTTARCRHCGESVEVRCGVGEEPDLQELGRLMEAHQCGLWCRGVRMQATGGRDE